MGQERMLAVPMDVEELSRLGERKGVCPYYTSRAALPSADVVLLPYTALLVQVKAQPTLFLCTRNTPT